MSDKIKEKVTIRLDKNLREVWEQYMAITRSENVSEVARSILIDGFYARSKFVLEQRFQEYMNKRDPFKLMKECERCGSNENLIIYYIDGNINNKALDNIVTLCKNCFLKFETEKIRREIFREKFIEWWFTQLS